MDEVYRSGFDRVAFMCPRSECPYLEDDVLAIDNSFSEIQNEQQSLASVAEDYRKYCAQFLQEVGNEFNDEIPPEIKAEYLSQAVEVKPSTEEISTAEVGDTSDRLAADSLNFSEPADVPGGQESVQPRRVAKPKRGRKRKSGGETKDTQAARTRPLANKYHRQPAKDDSNKLAAATQPEVEEESVVQKLRIRDMKRAAENPAAPTKAAEPVFTAELATAVLVPNVLSKRHGRAEDLKVNSLMDFVIFCNQSPWNIESKNGKKLDPAAKPRLLQPSAKGNEPASGKLAFADTKSSLGPKKPADFEDATTVTFPESTVTKAKCGSKAGVAKTLAVSQPITAANNCIKSLTAKPLLGHEAGNCGSQTKTGNENCGSMAFSRATVNLDKFKLPVQEVKHRGRPRGNAKKMFYPAAAPK
ncbi:hypothetical protein B566_EDAN007512 [Ephemera danica]|nr:hypothetical protein B566_EDAN007512 [Ephemera danica]